MAQGHTLGLASQRDAYSHLARAHPFRETTVFTGNESADCKYRENCYTLLFKIK